MLLFSRSSSSRSPRPAALAATALAASLVLSGCGSTGTTSTGARAGGAPNSAADPSASPTPSPSNPTEPTGPTEHTEGALPTTGEGGASASGEPTPSGSEGPALPTTPTTAPPVATQDTVAPTAPPQTIADPVDCSKVPCVALTFDDGPGRYTQRILDALEAADAKATFFLIGTQIRAYPQLVKAEAAAGMQLGNHTWDHANLTKLTRAQQLAELTKVDRELAGLVGVTPVFLRPPGGALDKAEKVALKRPIADWSVDTEDWRTRNTAQTIKAASAAKPGDIVLMHDIHASTAAAVPQILKNLRAKGYHLVTLTELIGQHPTLGIAYGWGQKPGGPKHR